MAHSIDLPERFAAEGWKVKVRDREIREPPHVTVIRKTSAWRWDLRKQVFMDREPEPRDVPAELVELLISRRVELASVWNSMYPGNPVERASDEQ